MTAYIFTIASLETGRRLGAAVVCPQARYASIAWTGAARLVRPFVTPAGWKALEREFAELLPAGPIPMASALVQSLALEHNHVVQYVTIEQLGQGDDLISPATLDQRLWQAALPPTLQLKD